jgi:hypothetical protein
MRGQMAAMIEKLVAELRGYIGLYVFEELCREWAHSSAPLPSSSRSKSASISGIGFIPDDVGVFWDQRKGSAVQLDVVAFSRREKRLFIGEAKWRPEDVSRAVLTRLIERSRRLAEVNDPEWKTEYALFGREAFTDATRRLARGLEVQLITLEQLERDLSRGQ